MVAFHARLYRSWIVTCLLSGLFVVANILCHPATLNASSPDAGQSCTPTVGFLVSLPGHIDNLVAWRSGDQFAALVGTSSRTPPYLPHDSLLIMSGTHQVKMIVLPPYLTPPGLAVDSATPSTVDMIEDSTLWQINVVSGRVVARWPLGLQANGWPAAVAAGQRGVLYVIGQALTTQTAMPPAEVEALLLGRPTDHPRVLWHVPLGFYHAGIWLGLASRNRLMIYAPGTYDTPGTISLLAANSGALIAIHPVPAPPVAIDAAADRFYVIDAGSIQVFSLSRGTLLDTIAGTGPVAVVPSRGLVAFVHRPDTLVLASARSLRVVAEVYPGAMTALAATPDGTALLAGVAGGLAKIDLSHCTAAS